MAKRGDGSAGGEERIFVKDGFRSFRRTYRVVEVYWGAGTGVVLLGIVGWVSWKGAHPDPSLFDMSAALSGGPPSPDGVDSEPRQAGERLGAPRAKPGAGEPSAAAAPGSASPSSTASGSAGSRGPLPAGLATGGYREGKVGQYSSENLYIKINGRAGYFQSFGVRSLHTVTLEGPGSEAAPASVDIEVYDLGESRNAIGAYNGERPPGIESLSLDGSTFHYDRNAGFLARGPYYVRFIGSDESEAVVTEVHRLLDVFRREVKGEALPWGFALFVDQLKLSASAVTYVKSNAFSFGFARDVFKATLSAADSKEDIEAFVVAAADPAAARSLATQYGEGFASLGSAKGQAPGKFDGKVPLYEDEFLATFSAVTVVERWLIGVRGAPSPARAGEVLAQLRDGVTALPEEVRARAVPSTDLDEPAGEYGGGAGPSDPAGAGPAPEGARAPAGNDPAPSHPAAPAAEGSEGSRGAAPGTPAEEGSDEY